LVCRKARTVVENLEQIVASEILMAGQALSLIADHAKEHPIGRGSQAALDALPHRRPRRRSMAIAGTTPRWWRRWIWCARALWLQAVGGGDGAAGVRQSRVAAQAFFGTFSFFVRVAVPQIIVAVAGDEVIVDSSRWPA